MRDLVVGDVNPPVVIQQDTRACFSAIVLSLLGPEKVESLGIEENQITRALILADLATENGLGIHSAEALNTVVNDYGLFLTFVYGAWGNNDTNPKKIRYRLREIEKALIEGKQVIVAYPKQRRDTPTIFHYVLVSGFVETKDGRIVSVMDPSDIDGGLKKVKWDDFGVYVTPAHGEGVMAWGVTKYDGARQNPLVEKLASPRDLSEDKSDTPGLELLDGPLWKESQTGQGIPPGTNDPVSTAMTTTSVMDQWATFGESLLEVNGQFAGGYPRFVVPGDIRRASFEIMGSLGWLPFPTRQTALDALHLTKTYTPGGELHENIVEKAGVFWIKGSKFNLDSWQYSGLGISSRQARAAAQGRSENDLALRALSEDQIRDDIARHTGAQLGDIYFFPTGMAAIHMLNKILVEIFDGAPSIQFGFPYTDTWEIQRKYGLHGPMDQNVLDQRHGSIDELRASIETGFDARSLFLEWPSNPLLSVPDIGQVAQIMKGKAPIIIDDTVGTMFNLDNRNLPSEIAVVVRSLTKFYSSVGNVMGGSFTLRPESPHYEILKATAEKLYEDNLWFEDAQVLAKNGRAFDEIMPIINRNGDELATWLNQSFAKPGGPIEKIYYPGLNDRERYEQYMTDHGGFGGLMTLQFVEPDIAYRYYDALRFTKGPSLGTFYSMACLYTRLAHKDVMPFIEKFGVLPHLIRLSIGIEEIDDLKDRTLDAMRYAQSNRTTFS